MLTNEDFDALRPYADNFDAAPPHLIGKLDAHISELNAEIREEFAAVQPPIPPVFTERNRKNAQKSTGPKSTAGKAASSRNRLAHGLCAKSLLIAGESETDFEELRQSVVSAYQPANAEETILADQVAQALWRYNRAQRIESTYLFFGQNESQRTLRSHGLDRPRIDKVSATISAIQGTGNQSTFLSQAHTVEGIVTALKSNGFFLQGASDNNIATSHALFVFTSSTPSTAPGDRLCVSGTVSEFPSASTSVPSDFGLTQLSGSPTFFKLGTTALPAPVVLSSSDVTPTGGLYQLEKFEGMRVQFAALVSVSPTETGGVFYAVPPPPPPEPPLSMTTPK